MHIVIDGIIFEEQPQGGISRIYQEILPRICNIDSSLRIDLLTSGKLKQDIPKHEHINHYDLPRFENFVRPRRLLLWSVRRPVRALIQQLWLGETKDKIWHSTYYTTPRKWKGLKVVTVPDLIHERFPDFFYRPIDTRFRKQKEKCISAADAVMCISESTKDDLLEYYKTDPEKVFITQLSHSDTFRYFSCGWESQSPWLEIDRPFFLYVGRRILYKNFDFLLHAYAAWSRRSEVDLIVVSGEWSENEKNLLIDLDIYQQVHLVNNINDDMLCQLYNRASAFVYPSLYEGFGIPLLEAMACGCPIVASRIPSSKEVAGECGLYFEPSEVDELIRAFEVVLSEGRDSRRVKMGLERAKLYSWDKTAEKTLEVYRSITKS